MAGNAQTNNTTGRGSKAVEEKKGGWLRQHLIPISMLLLVVVISVGLFIITQRYTEVVERFESYGYVGVFIISLVSNATVILPVPGIFAFIPLLSVFNPVYLGLVGAAGGVIGEITGYMAGYSGRGLARRSRMYDRVEGWMKHWGIWVIFVFSAAPFLLLDVAGMVAGALRYPLWKFLLVVWVGKSLKYVGLALAAAWGWEFLLHHIG